MNRMPAVTLLSTVAMILGSVFAGPTAAQGSGGQSGTKPPQQEPGKGGRRVFPYELVNYTKPAHDVRIMNSPTIVLGTVESYDEIRNTEKTRNHSVYLRVESWLRVDRPGLESTERAHFRMLPLNPPHKPMKVGDRCLLLLERDLRFDNSLVLGTDYYHYLINEDGLLEKLTKHNPTADDPVIVEQSVSSFLEEIRTLLHQVSLEQQTYNSDLVMVGVVTDSRQGQDRAEDFIYVKVEPEKVFKGDPGKGQVTFIQKANAARWAVQVVNRNSFKQGDRVLCFANKDPTYSRAGTWNPKAEPLWIFPYQRLSSLFLGGETAWRRAFRPILLEELYADLENWSAESAKNKSD